MMLFIGLGNELRGDDAVGVRVIKNLMESDPLLGRYLIEQGDLSRLLEEWMNRDVILIDAVYNDKLAPGSLCITEEMDEIIDLRDKLFSSHGVNLGHLLQLGKQLGKLPKSMYFVGVVGKNWNMGDDMSWDVKEGIKEAMRRMVMHAHLFYVSH